MAKIVKGELRGKPGRWIVDYYDAFGHRRLRVCRSKEQAEDVLAEAIREARHRQHPTLSPDVTVAEYSEGWVRQLAASLKPRSVESARDILRRHLLPVFGPLKVRRLARGAIKQFLADKLRAGLARNTVRLLHATLRAMLNAAIDDGLLLGNPAAKLGKTLRLVTPPSTRQEHLKALTREQLAAFLEAARTHRDGYVRRLYPLFVVMARTGVRVGEALALQWQDINWRARSVRVERGFSAGRLETPKSGHGRDVDLSLQTLDVLRRLQVKRSAETLRRGWGERPPWLFPNEAGAPLDASKTRKVFARILKAAGLSGHFSPHSLRHTFASLLLQHGESPAYVQRQLGHASIKLTVDTYGRWLPMGNTAAVDRLDDAAVGDSRMLSTVALAAVGAGSGAGPAEPSGGEAIAALPAATGIRPVAAAMSGAAELRVVTGEPCGTRTHDPLIKSDRAAIFAK